MVRALDEIARRMLRNNIGLTGLGGPGYRMVHHPRHFNKPGSCRSGLHGAGNLATVLMHGVPALMCKKCGEYIFQGLYGNTWSKKDMAKAAALSEKDQKKPRTKEEIMKQIWERDQSKKRRKQHMEDSISKYVQERMDLVK